MEDCGFAQNTHEWWHFSYGDQLWALIKGIEDNQKYTAFYGLVENTKEH